jgi:hypothetical protein
VIAKNVREADAIFLGDSRALVTFSANSIREFFKQANDAKPYNLAFAYKENSKIRYLKLNYFVGSNY